MAINEIIYLVINLTLGISYIGLIWCVIIGLIKISKFQPWPISSTGIFIVFIGITGFLWFYYNPSAIKLNDLKTIPVEQLSISAD